MTYIVIIFIELLFLYFLSDRLTKTIYTLLFFIFRNKYVTVGILTFIFLPGTVIHELAHLLTAEILRVPTGDISFTPKIVAIENNKQAVEAGHVTHAATDPLRRFLIGIAPLVWGLGALVVLIGVFQHYLTQSVYLQQQVLLLAGIGYLLFAVSNNMFSSRKDMEGAVYVIPVILFLAGGVYILGIRVALTGQMLAIFSQITSGLALALTIVIGINLTLFILNLFLLKLLRPSKKIPS